MNHQLGLFNAAPLPSVLGRRHAGTEVEGVDGPVGKRRAAGRPRSLEEHAFVRQVL